MDLAPLLTPNLPVGLLYLGDPPVVTRACVASATDEGGVIALPADAVIPVGARVILELPERADPRVIGQVTAQAGNLLTVKLRRAVPPERREYPRFRGWIHLRARVGDAEQADAWLQGADVLAVEHAPHPEIEVSATGLAFDARPWARVDDQLLLSVGIPREKAPLRCVARVMNVRALPADERTPGSDATHRFGVQIDPRCGDVIAALAQYTLRVQRAFLDGAPNRERPRARRAR